MTRPIKILSENNSEASNQWVLSHKNFKDWQLDFTYSVIHNPRDTSYLSGGLSSALHEYRVFQDNESWLYFLAVLLSGKVLIPIDVIYDVSEDPTNMKVGDIITTTDCRFEPQLLKSPDTDNKKVVFPIFTSVRHLAKPISSEMQTFLYLPFDDVLTWLQQDDNEITHIGLDLDESMWVIPNIREFMIEIIKMQMMGAEYGVDNIRSAARQAALQKHMPHKKKPK